MTNGGAYLALTKHVGSGFLTYFDSEAELTRKPVRHLDSSVMCGLFRSGHCGAMPYGYWSSSRGQRRSEARAMVGGVSLDYVVGTGEVDQPLGEWRPKRGQLGSPG